MAEPVRYIPIVVRWNEDGKVQQRTVNIEEGMTFNFEQSKKNALQPKACQTKGQAYIWDLKKEDAYNLLGLSHAKEDGYKNKKGEYIYVLDSKDIEKAKAANFYEMVGWIGSGGRLVSADTIFSKDPAKNGGLAIIHNGTNSKGQREEYYMSVFYNNKK